MNYKEHSTELIGKVLELEGNINELNKLLILCSRERDFYKLKFIQCNEWGGSEEYLTGKVPLNKLMPLLGNNKKIK